MSYKRDELSMLRDAVLQERDELHTWWKSLPQKLDGVLVDQLDNLAQRENFQDER